MTVLDKAMRAFVQHDGDRSAMSVLHWAATYRVEPDHVRTAWERAMTEHSLTQHNNCEVLDK